ncbi:AAA-type ATPase lid domain-containing protein [Sporosarcina sp. CAU 1771]
MKNTDELLFPFYSLAVEQAALGVHAVNKDGHTIIYNSKMKEIEGLELEDVKDRSILELFNLDQEDSTLLKVLTTEKELLNVKQTYWNRKGTEITTINDTFPVFDETQLIGAVELSRDVTALEKFRQSIRKDDEPINFNRIIAVSSEMQTVIATAKKAVQAKLPVLLIGESGTGKDLIAESIHNESSPSNGLFYTLHCHSSDPLLTEHLIEDLKNVDSYTLFCERIDLLTIPLQRKLLHELSNASESNHQCIASIGDDPVELIASGTLLKDLYYFFASFTIRIPPLRKRKEDILPFVSSYLSRRNERFGSPLEGISSEVEKLFLTYEWPGNMRELQILIDETTSLATTESLITFEMLPLHFRMKSSNLENHPNVVTDFIVQPDKELLTLEQFLFETEVYYLEKAMQLHNQNITKTANALGMSRQNLQYRLRKVRKS